jgi:hypothetical protein
MPPASGNELKSTQIGNEFCLLFSFPEIYFTIFERNMTTDKITILQIKYDFFFA